MVVVKLMGGLGNQMFQYAFGKSISFLNNEQLFLDHHFLNLTANNNSHTKREYELKIFENITTLNINKYLLKIYFNNKILIKIVRLLGFNPPRIINEKKFTFESSLLFQNGSKYFNGFWQSYKYFENISYSIKSSFTFPEQKLDDRNKLLLKNIRENTSVSIHVRRTDYLSAKSLNFHGLCSLDYYRTAIKIISSKFNDSIFYIFSDDIEWAKEYIAPLVNVSQEVSWNRNENSWIDMFLMSNCKHNILANSSFSWWSAWLNDNNEKVVVAPLNWFIDKSIDCSDLLPDSWYKI